MTERFWTPERKKHYYKLARKEESRREYMRYYMVEARKQGNIIHWREYKKMKGNNKDEKNIKKEKEKENPHKGKADVL